MFCSSINWLFYDYEIIIKSILNLFMYVDVTYLFF